jgi:hypothetical protein
MTTDTNGTIGASSGGGTVLPPISNLPPVSGGVVPTTYPDIADAIAWLQQFQATVKSFADAGYADQSPPSYVTSFLQNFGYGPSQLQSHGPMMVQLLNELTLARNNIANLSDQLNAVNAQMTAAQTIIKQFYDAAGYKDQYNVDPATVQTAIAHAVAYQIGHQAAGGGSGGVSPMPSSGSGGTQITNVNPSAGGINMTAVIAGIAALAVVGGGIWWWYASQKKKKAKAKGSFSRPTVPSPVPAFAEDADPSEAPRPVRRSFPMSSRPGNATARALMPRSTQARGALGPARAGRRP